MHQKYASQGLVVISVSIEEERQSKKDQEDVLKFLQKRNATMTNLVLDESSEVWAEKLGAGLRPLVFVFNRDGRWERFDATVLGEDDGDAKVEKLVVEWLKQK
ncbi:MAG: hypothetical protein K2R98_07370 [Gemmataceae bacterium]|nr:hypothetical protein [Gemmataceae bacterium]